MPIIVCLDGRSAEAILDIYVSSDVRKITLVWFMRTRLIAYARTQGAMK